MKITKILLVASLFFSLHAKAQHAITYVWPNINGLALNNACYTPTTFRSLKPIPVCEEYKVMSRKACEQRGDIEVCRPLKEGEKPRFTETLMEQKSCIKMTAKTLEVSRKYTESQCDLTVNPGQLASECNTTTSVEKWAGLEWDVMMFDNGAGDPSHGGDKHYLGRYHLVIPACEK